MKKWHKQGTEPLENAAVDAVEVHYMDAHNVPRYTYGVNGIPFGVYADVDGSKLGGAVRNVYGQISTAIPYERIVRWRYRR